MNNNNIITKKNKKTLTPSPSLPGWLRREQNVPDHPQILHVKRDDSRRHAGPSLRGDLPRGHPRTTATCDLVGSPRASWARTPRTYFLVALLSRESSRDAHLKGRRRFTVPRRVRFQSSHDQILRPFSVANDRLTLSVLFLLLSLSLSVVLL